MDCRIEAFKTVFGQHMRANHKDTISIAEVEDVVNGGADVHYSRAEIMSIFEVYVLVTMEILILSFHILNND